MARAGNGVMHKARMVARVPVGIVKLPVFKKIGIEYQLSIIRVIVPDQLNGDSGRRIRPIADLQGIIAEIFSAYTS